MIEIIPNWHPLFVHFTVALFSLSIIFFIVQRPFAETDLGDNLMVFARYSLWLGVIFSLATLAAGWDAYNTVDHDTPSHAAMTDHRNWGLGTFAVFFIAAIWWVIVKTYSEKASLAFLLCLVIGGGLLVTTGHKGSQLVYFFGLGVQNLPEKDDHKSGGGHSHEPGQGHDESDSSEENHDEFHEEDTGHDDLTLNNPINENVTLAGAEAFVILAKPKIEKYDDGTIRESLPEVAMDLQE